MWLFGTAPGMMELNGLSRSTIYFRISEGIFRAGLQAPAPSVGSTMK
jgi:predicted DNA-binding transcriptional regulator AlpA